MDLGKVIFVVICLGQSLGFLTPQISPTSRLSRIPLSRYSSSINKFHGQYAALTDTEVTTSKEVDDESSLMMTRSFEIASVAFDLVVPLISSGLKEILLDKNSDGQSWETFWSSTTNSGNAMISNADRVVMALEKLGPTYVKFGQALASRPDIIPESLATSLCSLQDDMDAFDTEIAKEIIIDELTGANVDRDKITNLVASLSEEPVAAASIGQVYKGEIDNMEVAVKVQRPGIREMVEKDAALLKKIASFAESIPSPGSLFSASSSAPSDPEETSRFINTEVVAAVDEFMSRVFEEMDYRNEAANAKRFADLYSLEYGIVRDALPGGGVVVPEIMTDLCTENILVMQWIEGKKLTSLGDASESMTADNKLELAENLSLIEQALYCTLSQLLEYGVMHADPHGGNLLKVTNPSLTMDDSKEVTMPASKLAYLDFGLLATIPVNVRDGLVCAVAQLVFAKDVEAVAKLFGELDLMDERILNDPIEQKALTDALTKTMKEVLVYPQQDLFGMNESSNTQRTDIPTLKFDKLLDGLVRLVPRFQFQLPPYFINNARALGTLEGIARSLDPEFNAFSLMYPYALNRILQNPSGSSVVDATLQKMVRTKNGTGKIDRGKVYRLLRDSAVLTGFSKRKVLKDILKTKAGKLLAREFLRQEARHIVRFRWIKNLRLRRRRRRGEPIYWRP